MNLRIENITPDELMALLRHIVVPAGASPRDPITHEPVPLNVGQAPAPMQTWMAVQAPPAVSIPPLSALVATAEAILTGVLIEAPSFAGGGPGMLGSPPARRPSPDRVQAATAELVGAHMRGEARLGLASQGGMITPGQVEDLAERVLVHLDNGGPVPGPIVRQGPQATAVPVVLPGKAPVGPVGWTAPPPPVADPPCPPDVLDAFRREVIACAQGLVHDALDPFVQPPPVMAPARAPVGASVQVDATGTTISVSSAPFDPGVGMQAPSGISGSTDAGGGPAPVDEAEATRAAAALERKKRDESFQALERAVRAVWPYLRALCRARGGLVALIAEILDSVGNVVPKHMPNDGPLVARVVASTLVGALSLRGIGLQPFLERDTYSPISNVRELPKPGMLNIDDGDRVWNVGERNPQTSDKG